MSRNDKHVRIWSKLQQAAMTLLNRTMRAPAGWEWRCGMSVFAHLVAIIVLMYLSVSAIASLVDSRTMTGDAIAVRRIYLSPNDYREYLPTISRLNPGVSFTVADGGNGLLLTVADEQLFPDLMLGLNSLQSFRPGVAWDLEELCIKKCGEEAVAKVLVKGFTQEMR